MLDMSKAFDTVNRKKLFKSLEEVLLPEEIHLLHILTNDVFIQVRVDDEFSQAFMTLIAIMQGDCLSGILFIFYLAQALIPTQTVNSTDHHYAIKSLLKSNRRIPSKKKTCSPSYQNMLMM